MIWKFRTYGDYLEEVGKWHRWFAWYPVKVADHTMCWLETVERSIVWHHSYTEDCEIASYRRVK